MIQEKPEDYMEMQDQQKRQAPAPMPQYERD